MDKEFVCEECGREFDSARGSSVHRTKIHRKTGKTATKCANCGKEIKVWIHEINEGNHFCSTECMGEYRSENYTNKNAPNWKGGKKELVCPVCGDMFKISPGQVDYRRCCSPECNHKYFSGENHPFYGEKRPKHSEKMRGENNPNYGGAPHLNGKNNPGYGRIDCPKPYFVEELNYEVRSQWEEEIGLLLKDNGINYLGYELKTFKLDEFSYTPDFLVAREIIVEVKGYLRKRIEKKYRQFMQAFPEIIFIIVGNAGDNPSEICDIHIPWEERERLVPVLKGLLEEENA